MTLLKYLEIQKRKVYMQSYEAKLLNDIKELMYLLEQRICNLEVKLQDLESSQGILEESLAYINRYLVEKN